MVYVIWVADSILMPLKYHWRVAEVSLVLHVRFTNEPVRMPLLDGDGLTEVTTGAVC